MKSAALVIAATMVVTALFLASIGMAKAADAPPALGPLKGLEPIGVTVQIAGTKKIKEEKLVKVVELGLRRNGIPLSTTGSDYTSFFYVYIDAIDITKLQNIVVFGITAMLLDTGTLRREDYVAPYLMWLGYRHSMVNSYDLEEGIQRSVWQLTDEFSLVWLRANPRY